MPWLTRVQPGWWLGSWDPVTLHLLGLGFGEMPALLSPCSTASDALLFRWRYSSFPATFLLAGLKKNKHQSSTVLLNRVSYGK